MVLTGRLKQTREFMLKYTDTEVTFAEIPDEITLCINLSNCPCHCEGCHSSYLAGDIGEVLTFSRIEKLLKRNKGITAVCFMGGDNDPKLVNHYASLIRHMLVAVPFVYPQGCGELTGITVIRHLCLNPIKIGWYSGRQELSKEIDLNNFDYIKLGPYLKECGPLNCKTTNQRFYAIVDGEMVDITHKFWKHETEN